MVTPDCSAGTRPRSGSAAADPADVERIIQPAGFFRAKTRSIIGMAQHLVERFDGEVPSRMDDLVTLPGVGRKTAQRRARRSPSTCPGSRSTPMSDDSCTDWASPI